MLPVMNYRKDVRTTRVRPHAVIGVLLALAAIGSALVSGCGGKSQDSGETQVQSPPAAGTTEGTVGGTATGAGSESDLGKRVYAERCVLCHGPQGKGDGTASAGLDPKPRNHTDGAYMNARANDELLGVIRNGKGAMPAWGTILSDAEIKAVVGHVRSLAQPPYQGPMP
jgi:mono/diheme cytochrome c family protein